MANELMANDASFGFLPWVRRGLASLAKNTPAQNFVTLQVELTVNATPTSPPTPPVSVRLHGPGQVTGIDARAIIRTDPRPDTGSFEPSFFPTVEFATPDFPWLFTPALPAGDQLRPWLCLAVIREQPGVALIARPRALSLLQFNAPAAPLDELPNLDQIAIWAHAQVVGDAQADLLSYLSGPLRGGCRVSSARASSSHRHATWRVWYPPTTPGSRSGSRPICRWTTTTSPRRGTARPRRPSRYRCTGRGASEQAAKAISPRSSANCTRTRDSRSVSVRWM